MPIGNTSCGVLELALNKALTVLADVWRFPYMYKGCSLWRTYVELSWGHVALWKFAQYCNNVLFLIFCRPSWQRYSVRCLLLKLIEWAMPSSFDVEYSWAWQCGLLLTILYLKTQRKKIYNIVFFYSKTIKRKYSKHCAIELITRLKGRRIILEAVLFIQ